MINKVIDQALSDFRELVFSEIKEELKSTEGGRVEMNVSFPCTIDEERYHTETIIAVFLDESGDVKVESIDDYFENTEEEDITLYSVDELLDMVKAM